LRLYHLKNLGTQDGMMNLNFLFKAEDLINTIENELKINPVSLIVIDAFADVFRGALNDAISVRTFMEPFKKIAQEHECVIIFNHHCGKHNQYKIPGKDNLLGSQGFESCMRTVIELRQDLQEDNKRHLCIVKGNNMGIENKNKSFELVFDFEKGFSNTGQRCNFEDLVLHKNSHNPNDLEAKILRLKEAGITSSRKIAAALREQNGPLVGKTKVAEILKRNLEESIWNDDENSIKKRPELNK